MPPRSESEKLLSDAYATFRDQGMNQDDAERAAYEFVYGRSSRATSSRVPSSRAPRPRSPSSPPSPPRSSAFDGLFDDLANAMPELRQGRHGRPEVHVHVHLDGPLGDRADYERRNGIPSRNGSGRNLREVRPENYRSSSGTSQYHDYPSTHSARPEASRRSDTSNSSSGYEEDEWSNYETPRRGGGSSRYGPNAREVHPADLRGGYESNTSRPRNQERFYTEAPCDSGRGYSTRTAAPGGAHSPCPDSFRPPYAGRSHTESHSYHRDDDEYDYAARASRHGPEPSRGPPRGYSHSSSSRPEPGSYRTETHAPRGYTSSSNSHAHSSSSNTYSSSTRPPFTHDAPNIDLYKVLDISRNATSEQLKKAFRELSMKNHPDRVPAHDKEAATKRMAGINQAYDVLKDERRRGVYDRTGEISV